MRFKELFEDMSVLPPELQHSGSVMWWSISACQQTIDDCLNTINSIKSKKLSPTEEINVDSLTAKIKNCQGRIAFAKKFGERANINDVVKKLKNSEKTTEPIKKVYPPTSPIRAALAKPGSPQKLSNDDWEQLVNTFFDRNLRKITARCKEIFTSTYPDTIFKYDINNAEFVGGTRKEVRDWGGFQLSVQIDGYIYNGIRVITVGCNDAHANDYKGVTGQIIKFMFEYALENIPDVNELEITVDEDASGGYWEKLSKQLGVSLHDNKVFTNRGFR